ncbi:winged helix-turn-helix transcriptional regulator [Streptomyces sp. PSAA01]|uniref:winged helix-turn-helix transcriptional regulator n=1 Tax=Streptomyces sp. PSAA01 TaxID=2912762 RepID=UPI0035ABE520
MPSSATFSNSLFAFSCASPGISLVLSECIEAVPGAYGGYGRGSAPDGRVTALAVAGRAPRGRRSGPGCPVPPRCGRLVASGVLRRSLYQRRPVRYEYLLTDAGAALLPLLVAMRDWGDRWVLGDGSLTATTDGDSADSRSR